MTIPNPLPPMNKQKVLQAVKNPEWQTFRLSLKGLSTKKKISKLSVWYSKGGTARIQVINYMGALLRGGQLKKRDNNTWYINR